MTETLDPKWQRYIGVPFVDLGRTVEAADCWGLYGIMLRNEFRTEVKGYEVYDGTRKEDAEQIDGLIRTGLQNDGWVEIEPGQERAGDGILIRIFGLPTHVGMVIAPGYAIHATAGSGSRLLKYHLPRHVNRVLGFYRHPDLV